MGLISVCMLERLPPVDDVNVTLAHFLLQHSSIRSSTEGSIHLNPLLQRFIVQDDGRWKQFTMGVKEVFEYSMWLSGNVFSTIFLFRAGYAGRSIGQGKYY
jgi:hypothetical protein